MDFSLSEEQKQVQDLINQFIAKDYPFDVREKLVKSEDGFSKEYWKTFGEFGLLAMPFPEDDGGFNGGPNKEQKDEILPRLFSGELQMSFAFTEPQSRFDLNDVTTSAKLEGDNYIVDGYKAVVMNGPSSEKIIVTCRTSGSQLDEEGISLLIIDKDSAGLSSRDYSNVDGSKASEITLENVSV